MGFSNKAAKAQQAAQAQAAKAAAEAEAKAAEEERLRKEKEQAKRDREQSYGARGQRLSSSLGQESAYSKGTAAAEDEKSNKLGNSALNYNLLNVKLG
jgi:hypothetical protein